jgi:hypothetical protein
MDVQYIDADLTMHAPDAECLWLQARMVCRLASTSPWYNLKRNEPPISRRVSLLSERVVDGGLDSAT